MNQTTSYEPIPEPMDPQAEPWVAEIMRETLKLRDASLVICRPKLIIEFKTEDLGRGLQYFTHDGHETWQIGEFRGHHCHVNLDSIEQVVFEAAPVTCQGGRLNYTVWFMVGWECENPFRKGGYLSVTLNSPYTKAGDPRHEVIDPVIDLYRHYQDHQQVHAEEGFLQAMTQAHPLQ
ncbi:MAG: hypothetical protein JAY75_12600 [Candidatus Thiodiazotropha taylori]|nr:hypothetical protein [Candidatus Thiodiazotropha taylori]MCG8092554.1 hypothetical protein [Candidatus Thiodiazotropha endolucinida]MCG7880459.1 hypothetical protein [Candidatus Thiodiazotropha taylori]MCG7887060.1 hypothetical protein [Candidatus Thiodiazotropha taylori]MCG7889090.1 hypothetical protein [Candidatus Thiodiazotropha taylori]